MSDLSRIVDEMCTWLDGAETAPLSNSAETLSTLENSQNADITSTFHYCHSFHAGNGRPSSSDPTETETPSFLAGASRVTSSYGESVESAERGGEIPAESILSLFPLPPEKMERVESEDNVCGRPIIDLNRAAPQRSDWWTGPAMAEAEGPVPFPGAPLPIAPADVRAGVARELRALAEDGRSGPDALRDAVGITAAKIRNAPALVEHQAHPGLCHACGDALDDARPVIGVLQAKGGGSLWLHHGQCHDAHSRRRAALVDRIMAAAGYGAEAIGESA